MLDFAEIVEFDADVLDVRTTASAAGGNRPPSV
jgi:hypothetical protein